MKFMKLAQGSFHKFQWNDHSCKILYFLTTYLKCERNINVKTERVETFPVA